MDRRFLQEIIEIDYGVAQNAVSNFSCVFHRFVSSVFDVAEILEGISVDRPRTIVPTEISSAKERRV